MQNIDERNARSLKLMKNSNVPKFNWTIDEINGDIIGMYTFFFRFNYRIKLNFSCQICFDFIDGSGTVPASRLSIISQSHTRNWAVN